MTIKRAKVLDDEQFPRLMKWIDENSVMPIRDRLLVLLSFKAGLRVSEIVKIDISAMTNAEGKIAKVITIFSNVGKGRKMREVPMHADIEKALREFRKHYKGAEYVALSSQPFRFDPTPNPRKYRRMSVNALTIHFHLMFREAGFEGASSHSGRRTFGTRLAQRANNFHQSLRDVQNLMGHARLETTEKYLEPTDDTVDMVNSL